MKRKPLVFLICLASFALAACVDEHDGECNVRDYSEVWRINTPDGSDADSGSVGRDEASQR